MSIPTLEHRPTHKAVPLLRSELSRITHRRLFRVLALILLGGIILVSVVAFFTHSGDVTEKTDLLQKRQAKAQQFWETCVTALPEVTNDAPVDACGTEPAKQSLGSFAYTDDRYKAYENLPLGVIGVGIAAAGVAFLMGASSGGAEWSSRSMTLQLLFEPRRLRLLTVKWLGLVISLSVLAAVALVVALGLGAITASLRGTWEPEFAPVPQLQTSFGTELALMCGRALILVVIAATIGYAIAMLVRNTGASLGVAFVYFVVVENVVRFALMRYGTEPFMFSDNAVAYLFPGGLPVPGKREPGEMSFQSEFVQLTNLRSFVTLMVYTALLAVPAAWSFTRRDVG
jgi:hypothetical protein